MAIARTVRDERRPQQQAERRERLWNQEQSAARQAAQAQERMRTEQPELAAIRAIELARVALGNKGFGLATATRCLTPVRPQLQAPGYIRDLSPNARRFLENIAPLRPSLPRSELNHWVRTFVWAATWNPDTRKVDIVFDEIGLENAMTENPELLKPLSDEALRKLQRTKGARRRGAISE